MNKEEILEDVKASMAIEDMPLTVDDLVFLKRLLDGEDPDVIKEESIQFLKTKYNF